MPKPWSKRSLAAQAIGRIDPVTKAVVPPIHMASTYQRDEDNGYSSGRIYARADNPTFDQAEATLAALEGGAEGAALLLGHERGHRLLPGAGAGRPRRGAQGDVLVAAQLAGDASPPHGASRSTSSTPTDPTRIAAAVRPGAHQAGLDRDAGQPDLGDHRHRRRGRHRPSRRRAARRRLRRSATPVLTRPIELGADIVMHSATKYPQRPLRHHRRRPGRRARRRVLGRSSRTIRAQLGTILGQIEAWLLLRGMRTLFPRVAWALPLGRDARRAPRRPSAWWPRCSIPACRTFAGHASRRRSR